MVISNELLDKLLVEARKCFDSGEIPVAAAVVDSSGNIISLCGNSRQSTHHVIDHAEISCVLAAEDSISDWRLDGYSLIVTLAPCNMCLEIIKECRLDHVFYILDRNSSSFNYNNCDMVSRLSVDNLYYQQFSNLLTSFFDIMRH